MYDKRAERDAIRYCILDRIQAFEDDLMKLSGITNVEFDIRDYGDLHQIIFLPRYNIDVASEDYYSIRRNLLSGIINTCMAHDLKSSGDAIEDYGESWYIVRSCGKSWR